MIKKYNEFYTGPYKAAGFKHYEEFPYSFVMITTKEGLNYEL